MIQRKQTLFLLIGALLLSLFFFFPFLKFELVDGLQVFLSFGGFSTADPEISFSFTLLDYWLFILAGLLALTILLNLAAVMSFKNRRRQMRLCAFCFLSGVLFTGALFLASEIFKDKLLAQKMDYLWIVYLPILYLLLVRMAQRAIRKDEDLVRSLDRIR